MKVKQLIIASLAFSVNKVAFAGLTVPLGASLGITLGNALGTLLGSPLGTFLPIASGGLLSVAAVSLVLGICIVRRKQNH